MTSKQLLRIRRQQGWTQLELAEKLNVHTRTIMRWENDQVEIPEERADRIRQLAEREGVRV